MLKVLIHEISFFIKEIPENSLVSSCLGENIKEVLEKKKKRSSPDSKSDGVFLLDALRADLSEINVPSMSSA